MSFIGSWKIDDLLTFVASTQTFSTGVATDADSAPAYRVYEDETGTPILTGTMALLDSANTAGFYSEQITLSAANGFEKGKCYSIYISATVSSVAGATHRTFQIQAEVAVASINANVITATAIAADAITAAKVADGTIDAATFATGAITATAIAADAITDAKVASDVTIASVTGAVGSVTGAVGSVTGNVGGNVTGSVGSVATGGIAAATFAAGAIDAAALAADAGTEIGTAVWATTTRQLTGTQTFNVTGNITGNLSGSVGSVTGAVGSVTGSVGSVTGSVGSVATGGIVSATFAAGALDAVWGTATRLLTAGTNIVLAKGTGVTGFNDLSAAQVNTEADTALADVGVTTTVTGRIDAAITTRASQTSVDTIDDFLDLEVAAIKAKTDNLPATPAATGDIPTANQNADALLDRAAGVETGLTPRQALRLLAAVTGGKLSGGATTTNTIRNAVADSKNRVVATVDTDGNRTAIVYDLT